jgi:Zn-dependent M28 family amino/carboxypeptidase
MKKIVLLLLTIAVITVSAKDPKEITVKELKDHVAYLASDPLQGRKPGMPGGDQAAEYIKKQLKKDKPVFLADKGLQRMEVITSVKAGEQNKLSFADVTAKPLQDFTPLAFSASATAQGPVAFVGYGFDFANDSLKWHDYDGIEVKGRWVMILRDAPDNGAPNSGYESYTSLRKKSFVAKDRGAIGVLFVSGEKSDKEDELLPLRFDGSPANAAIPILQIKRTLADKILAGSGKTIAQLEAAIYTTKKSASLLVEVPVSAHADVVLQRASTANVVAVIPGNDPVLKNEYIVLGAHYDHLGMGGPGSGSRRPDTIAVHNGADDNASGVSAILEVAEALAAERKQLKRSIVVVAFTAEEMGTLGSKYFVDNPLVPLKQIKYMINLDMVGRMKPEDKSFSIGGSGTADGMEDILKGLANDQPYTIKTNPEGYGPSDHAAFYAKDIPVLFFMAGMHEDYHTPADDADRLNYEGEKWLADYVLSVVRTLANRQEALAFKEAGPKTQPQGGRRFKVTLGIMPDFTSTSVKGVRAEVVMPGRPASRAGMLKGDVIVAIEGKPVNDIYEYMHRLGELRTGERISVEILRNGQKEILIVEL